MTIEQRMKNLLPPTGRVDVVLDTDAYNEIDDQFAISYLLRNGDRLNTRAIYAAPFYNKRSESPLDGMRKSYDEILHLLSLLGETREVFQGSERYLENESTPVESPAARDLAARVEAYSPERPLYVVAIGAITNVASAISLNPHVAENIVLVWLGGHALHYHDTKEFNMWQDIAAARAVMNSGVPLVQLPCRGVVSAFTVSKPELEYWLVGKNPLATYLAEHTIAHADAYAKGKPWTRVIWDVTAVAWLLNGEEEFMHTRLIPTQLPSYQGLYEPAAEHAPLMRYVYYIKRDVLLQDLFEKIASQI